MEPTTEEIMTGYPKVLCRCGRQVRVHPETKAPRKHRIGREHPDFRGMGKSKRREKWCPEVAE
jgi:hypothetical protein